ncbi:chemotaxis protein CheA [Citreimonas salinaria]|uniref:Chemotaxis protein CheA n=1 Tax=Citreimonas salinaria TaxID=321339 RepID=A0A1H3MRK1_9RHOB|nr:chemotaxis protein CheA [Citreimonas salinaria]SDY79297.1 two-component system, chemotaxis family, sensor kinase CheA [Citreimonas salinaria]
MNPATQSFIQEASEILEGLDVTLLELEASPTDSARIDAVFRALHTLKGSGAMFGFTALSKFLHHFENAFDRIRSGEGTVSADLIQLSLASRDHMERMIARGPDPEAGRPPDAETDALVEKIRRLVETMQPGSAPASDGTPTMRRFVIDFRPSPDAMRNGLRPDLLLAELADLGTADITCLGHHVPALEDLDPTVCHLAWHVVLVTGAGRGEIEEVFLFASDGDLEITELGPVGEPASAPGSASEETPAAPEAAQAAEQVPSKSTSVRVQSHRLDELMDQLGELVIAQARLNRISSDVQDSALAGVAEEIERLVTGLRDATLSIRMLPVELVFGKFRRVVRDLSGELGKQVKLDTRGGETEVDKNVIDSLTEPLVHIIRNAIDHGIESPQERAARGKPEHALVKMQARQSGGEVLISVTDDGAGLDAEAIRARAIERGLLAADQEASDEQLYNLIFEPGFSTAKSLSSVSGRGVGMDAVRRVIEDLRGVVEVKSRPGLGTQVTLRLPLTLAIIDGLLVKVAGVPFVLPLSSVEECVDLPADEKARESGRALLRIRDELVPYVNLDTLFGFDRLDEDDRRIVVSSVDGKRMGLVVDEVVGQHQTVIKPLSIYHRGIEGLSGSTILGDGSVAMILDVTALVKRAQAARRVAA